MNHNERIQSTLTKNKTSTYENVHIQLLVPEMRIVLEAQYETRINTKSSLSGHVIEENVNWLWEWYTWRKLRLSMSIDEKVFLIVCMSCCLETSNFFTDSMSCKIDCVETGTFCLSSSSVNCTHNYSHKERKLVWGCEVFWWIVFVLVVNR
jgi:hypothetical protein